MGDFGTATASENDVAAAVRAREPELDALVTTGDNIYPGGEPARFEAAWHRPYGWVAQSRLPVVASIGNHDVRTSGGAPVMRLLGMPGPFYERTIDPVRFIVLDSNRPSDPEQDRFLTTTLARPDPGWTVVVFHRPAFTCGIYGEGAESVRRWHPALVAAGVDLVLSGHDHNYQRFHEVDGVTYVVTGGGGAKPYPMRRCLAGNPPPAASAVVHHFTEVTATRQELSIRAVDVRGAHLDEVVLQ